LDVLKRTLDEESARTVEDPEAVRGALRRHFSIEHEGKVLFATSIDLLGHSGSDGDPNASPYWLPLYDAVERFDSVYRRTVRGLGPEALAVLQWLRRAPLDNGIAAELVDAEGRATGNGGDAALAGLLAWSTWYAVHALGVRP